MTYQELMAQLPNTIAAVYCIHGEEPFLCDHAAFTLQQAVVGGPAADLNHTIFGENAAALDIVQACQTLPFLAERKLVQVRDYVALAIPGKAKGEEQFAVLEAYLAAPNPSSVLLFTLHGRADARGKLFALLKKYASVVECVPLTQRDLSDYAMQQVRANGFAFKKAAADLLAVYCADIDTCAMELEKLFAYASGASEITADMIQQLVQPRAAYTVFQLVDAVVQKNAKQAFALYSRLKEEGEEPVRILSLITRQFRLLYFVKTAQGAPADEVAKQLGITAYVYRLVQRQAPGATPAQLAQTLAKCTDVDYAIKSGTYRQADMAVQLFIAQLAQPA